MDRMCLKELLPDTCCVLLEYSKMRRSDNLHDGDSRAVIQLLNSYPRPDMDSGVVGVSASCAAPREKLKMASKNGEVLYVNHLPIL